MKPGHASRPPVVEPNRGVVHALPFTGGDEAFAEALRTGHPGAKAALFDMYGVHVARVITRVVGIDHEVPDLVHEVFLRAFAGAKGIREAASVKGWVTMIAVFTGRECIRRRSRKRWLKFFATDDVPDGPAPVVPEEATEAVRAAYAIFDRMAPENRVVLGLRLIEGMSVNEIAEACQMSVSKVKRRLSSAEPQFLEEARQSPALSDWLAAGDRWGGESKSIHEG